ncbi:MAG TPA: DUF3379 family protein [Steroidobacteraceae bacterium]|nr:DUF3379 family protein [Steroidobacteraceae bacterium]
MSNEFTCSHARLAIGGDPHEQSAELLAHLATCADCTRFRTETLALDARLRAAFELSLTEFRKPARPAPQTRRFALAASVILAMLAGAGFWLLKPQSALAGDVLEHVKHEAASWDAHDVLTPSQLAEVMRQAGVQFDDTLPVVYAMACPFRGRRVPHLVVQTARGPFTVMVLAHEKVASRVDFAEDGYHGTLFPVGEGSVAVLGRGGRIPDGVDLEWISGALR